MPQERAKNGGPIPPFRFNSVSLGLDTRGFRSTCARRGESSKLGRKKLVTIPLYPPEDPSRKTHAPSHCRTSSPFIANRGRIHAIADRHRHAGHSGARLAGDFSRAGLAGGRICLGQAADGPHQASGRTNAQCGLAIRKECTREGLSRIE